MLTTRSHSHGSMNHWTLRIIALVLTCMEYHQR